MSSDRPAAPFALALLLGLHLLLALGCGGAPSTIEDAGGDAGRRSEPDAGLRDAGLRDAGATDLDAGSPDGGTDAGGRTFLPAVVRVAYRYTANLVPDGAYASVYAGLHVVTLTGLDTSPERIQALYDGRRELGGDCVAYVEEDRSPVSFGTYSGDIFSSAFVRGGDIGPVSASFEDTEGRPILATTQTYDEDAGRYPSYRGDTLLEAPLPTLGAVRITTGGSNPETTTHPLIPPDARFGTVYWSSSGFSIPMETFDSPGVYFTFGLIGSAAKATVVCAAAASDGMVTLRVPDLNALLTEIGRDGSAPDHTAYDVGLTDVVDPRLSGPYGLVEQAAHGPARLVEWRQPYFLRWGVRTPE